MYGSAVKMSAVVVFVWFFLWYGVTFGKRLQQDTDTDFDKELSITSDEKVLARKLLERYERQGKEGRPVVNTSHSVKVEFGLSLIQILDVDVKNQVLTTNVWYEYKWKDVLLRWDKSQYENISDVRIPADKIWLPDILLYNFADERLKEQRSALAVVRSDGDVLWMPQAILRSSCAFDTLYFPLDEQICILKFGSWTYNGLQLDIHFKADQHKFEMESYIQNHEWDIIENTGHRNIKKYTCCPEPYPDLKFKLRLRRRVAFYSLILIMPCALLSLLTMVIFWVPPESPAKLTLGMSIFLAFFVLLLLLAESTPKATLTIPLIGAYFCLNMIMITMSEILACVVANMHFRGVRINRAPRWLRHLTINIMARVFCMQEAILEKDEMMALAGQCKKRCNSGRIHLLASKMEKRSMCPGHEGQRYGFGFLSGDVVPGFQFPHIRDEFLTHGQANAKILDETRRIHQMLERVKDKKSRAEEKDKLAREWRVVAIVTDRIIFAIYVIINVTGLVVTFIGQANRDELTVRGFDDM